MTNTLYKKHLITISDIGKHEAELVVTTARKMREIAVGKGASDILSGKLMTALFYEPSSRTFGSFIAAIQRLGGAFIPLQGVTYSSVSKGETLSDTVRTFASYSDIIVIRHPEVGSAGIASEFSPVPVINAGDGVGEHPTQALLDFFTITDRFGKSEGLTVTLVGDLLNGRTVHSLVKLLSLYKKVTIRLVSPAILRLPGILLDRLRELGVNVSEHTLLEDVLTETDVLYVTRVQKERFTDLTVYEKLKRHYVITGETLKQLKKAAIIMHPFPRVGEIAMEVDLDPRAHYITKQMQNGMFVRMAILSLILRKEVT